MLKNTPVAVDTDLPEGSSDPSRQHQQIYRILRDTKLARKLKLLHQNKCQLCNHVINLPNGSGYSEAHHIKPLGQSHGGPDTPGNILILCPNHHAMLDYGVIKLSADKIATHPKHQIYSEFIEYHNKKIYSPPLLQS